MAHKILLAKEEDDKVEPAKNKLVIKLEDLEYYLGKNLPLQLITKKSKRLFDRFGVSQDFLQLDPLHWRDQESYINGREILKSFKVVNDTAERGVKLMEEFNDKFTKDESQKQFVLQTVQDYRRKYPKHTREVLRKAYMQSV